MTKRIVLVAATVIALAMCVGCCGLTVADWMADFQCPRGEGTSQLRSDPVNLPEDLTSLGVLEARYLTYDRCSVSGVQGFVTLDPDASERLRTRYTWAPADAPELDEALAAQAPANPAWQRSEAWESESSRYGWQTFLRDAGSGRVYFDDTYGD